MTDLFASWRSRIDANSQHAVDVYTDTLPDFRQLAVEPSSRAAMLQFAVFLRDRTITLAAEDKPFTDNDLAFMAAVGWERGTKGVSLAAQRHVLLLHTSLTLREVHEAARPHDVDDVMRALRWLPIAGSTAQQAYTRGYLKGRESTSPLVERVRLLVSLLLTDDPTAADQAASLAMPLTEHCTVAVARVEPQSAGPDDRARAEVVADLLARHWIPLHWVEPNEFVAVVGADGSGPVEDRTLAVARDFAERAGLACAVGAAHGSIGDLATTLALARKVSRVAPRHARASAVCYLNDVFAELGVAHVPPVDDWLRQVAHRLAGGPNLVTTLDAFYRNDMSRGLTAAALGIHPRTLDYRLQRVQDLTGLDPLSVRGVRILSTTINRVLAGAWT